MKVFSQLVRLGALATALAVPACQAFAIRRSTAIKRAIYEVPEIEISGLSLNSSSSPSFDFLAGTASVDGDLNVFVNFTSDDDAVTYGSLQVQGFYVYGGGDSTDLDNSTQIACGTLTGPISINSSQPLQVPISLQISNLSLSHPIVVDIASICLGSQGGEIQTVWGGWLDASVANETYRCPLPVTNVTIPCPSPTLQSPSGEADNTCSFIPAAPLPPADSTSSSDSPTSSSTDVAGTSTTEETATQEPTPEPTPEPLPTPIESTTTDISTPTETPSESSGSTVTPTEATTVSPGVTIATPTPTTSDGTTSQVVPVIVTVTETATAAPARRRRNF